MAVVFDDADRGKQATYFARWGGKRNEFGQWNEVSRTPGAVEGNRAHERVARALPLLPAA